MKEKQDGELFLLVKQKQRPALEELYDRYIKRIYSYVYKFMNGNEEHTREIIQLVFLKLWTTDSNYDASKGEFINWLLTITRNICLDYIRKEKKSFRFEPKEYLEIEDQVNDIEKSLILSEVAWAKSKLSEAQKRLIDLLYWKGYTLAEVARMENEPVGTIKSRLHQSLKQLKKHLEMGSGSK